MRPFILAATLLAWPGLATAQDSADDEPALPAGLDEQSDEPALPAGLEEQSDEPALPAGLGDASGSDGEPDLPTGLDDSTTVGAVASDDDGEWLPFELNGFANARAGSRIPDDATERRASLGELRLQLEAGRTFTFAGLSLRAVGDLIYDPVLDEHDPDLETGEGFVDLREVNAVASPVPFADIKLGRQILTWGTGDLLFVNDLFPKDWTALLIGRDLEYLKAPSDAVKLSLFHELANVDVVYTPRFDADRFPDRRRVSSWDPMLGAIAGRNALIPTDQPDDWFGDDEWAVRLHRRVGAYEVAAYGYHGFWKSPAGFDPMAGVATFPALSVYGASARAPLFGGIASVEGGYYDSRDDRDGDDPLVRDSEVRALVGFERELAPLLTGGAQYYIEAGEDTRHVITLRLTWLAMAQRLQASLFAFASPSDQDAYLRPKVSYAIDDHWRAEVGGNLFFGADDDSFFGQFSDNTNVYSMIRYSW